MSIFYPEGLYTGEVVQQALGETKKGDPQFILRVRLTKDSEGNHLRQQFERTIYRVINENTQEWVIRDLKTLGYTRDSFRFIDPNDPRCHSFVGQEVPLLCKHGEWEGKEREEWSIYGGSGALEVKPLAADKMRKLDQMFGKALKDMGANAPATAKPPVQRQQSEPPPPPPDPKEISDDDVPF